MRRHVTSFPRSLSCQPPSNRCVPPDDVGATRLALGNASSKKASTVALLIGLGYCRSDALPERRRRCCRKPLPLAAGFVAGWLKLSLPGRCPEAGILRGGGRKKGLTSCRCRRGLRGCYDPRARPPGLLCSTLVAAVRPP